MPAPVRRTLSVLSPWQRHARRWAGCTACMLHAGRTEPVLYRGELPCDALFVGEAPGKNENAVGQPFVGPAGQLLDKIIAAALDGFPRPVTLGFTNLVACIPLGEDGDKTEAPPDDAVAACAGRVAEVVAMARPRLLVRVGKEAQGWLTQGYRHSVEVPYDGPVCNLYHPAWMLRKPDVFRDQEAQRAAVILRTALFDALIEGGRPARVTAPRPADEIPF